MITLNKDDNDSNIESCCVSSDRATLTRVYEKTKNKQTEKDITDQRKTIVNSWVRCLENNQLVITSGFPTVNFRK